MKVEDIQYLCSTIGNLAGIPIRIYKGKKQIFYYSLVDLPKDPVIAYEEKILKIDDHIGYFITPRFHYYGIVNSSCYKIVLGPSRQWKADKADLTELSFQCDVPPDETEAFVTGMQSLIPIPLNSILQTMCSMNFVLNGEKFSLADMTIYEEEQSRLSEEISALEAKRSYGESTGAIDESPAPHNTLTLEQTVMNFVSHGDTAALKAWLKNAPAVRPGTLSSDALRQLKNTFIVTTTLAARAAIRGGMDADVALSLSDAYIQKCELLYSLSSIENLQYHMVYDYTERAEKIRLGKSPSKLTADIANYVQKHLSEPVDIEALCKAVYVSRTHLAVKFKKETGMTLTEYVLREKIEEGKRLLRYTDKPISSIAGHLGFSSQSHFANTFKKYVECTPKEYRLKQSR